METVDVVYIGSKPLKQDNVANTGTVWIGPGDVKPVPVVAWPLLARHATVWRLKSDGETALAAAPVPAPQPVAPPNALPPQEQPAVNSSTSEIGIYGMNHPPEILIGEQLLQLGDVVAAAQAGSGLNVDDWNALEDGDRFDFVEAHIAKLRAEDADRRSAAAATQTTPTDGASATVAAGPVATAPKAQARGKGSAKGAEATSSKPARKTTGKRGAQGG